METGKEIPVLEVDELFTYVKKNRVLIWTAVDRNGGGFVGFKVGDSRHKNFEELCGYINSTHKVETVCSDHNSIY